MLYEVITANFKNTLETLQQMGLKLIALTALSKHYNHDQDYKRLKEQLTQALAL